MVTGLSGAGKTTISEAVAKKLEEGGFRCQSLDAATARENLGRDLGFSKEDRAENVRRIGFVAGLLVQHGVITLVAAMSPERQVRDEVLHRLPAFLEVFVDAPIAVCERRDPVGLYRRFHDGEIQHLSGLDEPYEAPLTQACTVALRRSPSASARSRFLPRFWTRSSRHRPSASAAANQAAPVDQASPREQRDLAQRSLLPQMDR